MNSKIAVILKTSPGRPSLKWCINSIEYALQDHAHRLYISDEEPLDSWKENLYNKLSSEGHYIKVHRSSMRCGVARNLLVDNLMGEELVLRLDDDFELGGEFNLEPLKKLLTLSRHVAFSADLERQIGDGKSVSSGRLRPYGADFRTEGRTLVKAFHSPFRSYRTFCGYRYSFADFTRNLILIKRSVLEEISWDETLIFQGEHADFMRSVNDAGYKGVYTPDSIHYHRDDLAEFRGEEDNHARADNEGERVMERVFRDKWSYDDIDVKYPWSWYITESLRRLISYIIP